MSSPTPAAHADGARRLAEFVRIFLVRHAPFDRMQAAALDYLARHLEQVHFSANEVILAPESGVVGYFYIVEHGKVQARQAGAVKVTDYSVLTLGPGECFPIGAVSARRATTNLYTALEETFCYRLPAAEFLALQAMSPEFNHFCTQYIASLLLQSRQQLQVQFAQRASEQQTLSSPLSGIGSRQPVTVPPAAPIRAALEVMAERRVGSLVVCDAEQKPLGIFTQSDLLRRVVLTNVDQAAAIATVMTADPAVLDEHATAYDAMLAMARRHIRHLCVVDAGGRLTGVVSERDLFSLQRIGLRQIRYSIESASDIAALQMAAADVRQLAFNMLAQGIGSQQLTQFVSALNDALTRRILELNVERHALHGVRWAWLAFGSEGRDEQTFSTDQDNGIVFVADAGEGEAWRTRLLTFAKAVNHDLDACGFALCKGNIMASNPQWCMTLPEWEEQFANWIRNPVPEALLNATIFFDFRPLFGDDDLAEAMRRHLMSLTTQYPIFLKAMAANALDVEPPLGTFRDFRTDLEAGHPGKIDLKKYGVRLFVDIARIYALATGVPVSNTVQRLRQSGAVLKIRPDEVAACIEAFDFIQLLRLRHQMLDSPPGQGDNLIAPESLNELDRRILKESFRQARKLQSRLKLDYQAG
ncbi:MAG TPA: DUF294 nucleotidyltransferase-like domain-containing protein [Rhodocyclaceae bacterium]|nr:DUF294 nucleotidyltransferase-like domain-containing protein [Rhodocyclaceae bacterium]